jgi:hypothetical protein
MSNTFQVTFFGQNSISGLPTLLSRGLKRVFENHQLLTMLTIIRRTYDLLF